MVLPNKPSGLKSPRYGRCRVTYIESILVGGRNGILGLLAGQAKSKLRRPTDGLKSRKMRAIRISRESRPSMKQNVTVSLDHQTLRKAKILAAKRGTSISGLLARQIEDLVGEEDAYERAERQALSLLEKGFRMGGVIQASRDQLHER